MIPLLLQHLLCLKTPILTTSITSQWSLLLQHLLRHYDLYYYSNYHITIQIVLQQLLRPNDLFYYSNSNVTMLSVITASNTSLWSLLLQPIMSLWSLYPANVHHAPIAATGGLPPDAPYQERPGGRHAKHPRICILCYHIVFSVLPFVLFDICRTEDHKPRGRASDVSTISTCVSLYVQWFTAHSPTQSLWERAGGITVVYLCGF